MNKWNGLIFIYLFLTNSLGMFLLTGQQQFYDQGVRNLNLLCTGILEAFLPPCSGQSFLPSRGTHKHNIKQKSAFFIKF